MKHTRNSLSRRSAAAAKPKRAAEPGSKAVAKTKAKPKPRAKLKPRAKPTAKTKPTVARSDGGRKPNRSPIANGAAAARPGAVLPVRPSAPGPVPLYVVSDSTGNLPRHMASAFLTQFPPGTFELRLRPFVESVARLEAGFAGMTTRRAVVFHAVVDPAMKARIAGLCAERGFPCRDLTGPFVDFLAETSGVPARSDVARLHHVGAAYERRVAALEFTLEHDDGLGLSTLHEADVVLAGASRTGKTPTSILLALEGYRTANVALAMQVQPPAELLSMPRERVAALIVAPHRLSEIRLRRNHDWQMGSTDYDRIEMVEREIAWCRRLFARQGWAVFDITGQAVEETAARIVHKLGLRKR